MFDFISSVYWLELRVLLSLELPLTLELRLNDFSKSSGDTSVFNKFLHHPKESKPDDLSELFKRTGNRSSYRST